MDTTIDSNARTVPFRFHGNAGEYFRIWIVNVVLSIVTLGVYSAWAKVRNKRYFYNNTELDGSTFDYHADPMAILKGRLIAFGVFMCLNIAVNFQPLLQPLLMLLLLTGLPWLMVRALSFNARNSSYRNIRFDFRSNYAAAAKVYILYPLLIILTFGLAYPYFDYKHRDFIVDNSGYGTADFDFDARASQFYAIYLKAFAAIFITGVVMASMIPDAQSAGMAAGGGTPQEPPQLPAVSLLPMLGFMALYLMAGIYIKTATTNAVFNHAHANGYRFTSSLQVRQMFWIYFSNLIAILVSAGLLIPWARVRLIRYRMEHLTLEAPGDLDHFIAGEQERVTATGAELADIYDIDLGL